MEIYLNINKNNKNKQILIDMIKSSYHLTPLLIIWHKKNLKIIINNKNYMKIIDDISNDDNDYYWWLKNDEFFSAEYSNKLNDISIEIYSNELFKQFYNIFQKTTSLSLYIFIDNVRVIQNIKKSIKILFKEEVLYEDDLVLEYEYIIFSFLNEFSIELKNIKYIEALKNIIKYLKTNNMIYDDITLIEFIN